MEPSAYAHDPEFLEAQRQRLHDAPATADRVAGDLEDDVRAEGTDDPGDLQLDGAAAQHGTIPMDREWRIARQAQERVEGAAIDAASARLDGGDYGRCESCDRRIERERLEALPFAVRCERRAGIGSPVRSIAERPPES